MVCWASRCRRGVFITYVESERQGHNPRLSAPVPKCGGLYSLQSGGLFQKAGTKVADMDCAIPAFHGMHGEDGCMQGLFELCDIPYSSVGVTGSGVGMDKIVMKAVFQSMGLPVLPAKYCYRSEWQAEPERVLDQMESVGAYPLFVKPANLVPA